MPTVTLPFLPNAPPITLTSVIDIILVATLIYQLLSIIRGRRAAPIVFGVLMLVIVYLLSAIFRLELLRTVLATLVPYTAFALIVMFQSDLRRLLARLGPRQLRTLSSGLERRDVVRDIVFAVTVLAERKVGALIVVERDIGLRTFVESGIKLDACVSRDLLLSIFHPKAALHDGAVIIQKDRITAAACFLPLTMNPQLARSLGTRHRAAIGITEESDCIAVVVSEETAQIGVAAFGEIQREVSPEQLADRLMLHARHKERLRGPADNPQPVVETVREVKEG
jgi:diadenylate cyclase